MSARFSAVVTAMLISIFVSPAPAQEGLARLEQEYHALQRMSREAGGGLQFRASVDPSLVPPLQPDAELPPALRGKFDRVRALSERIRRAGPEDVAARRLLAPAESGGAVLVLGEDGAPGTRCEAPLLLSLDSPLQLELQAQGAGQDRAWFRWHAPAAGSYRLSTIGSEVDTALAVYEDCAAEKLSPIAANDDAIGLAAETVVTAEYVGQPFVIRLDNQAWAGQSAVAVAAAQAFRGTVTRESDGQPLVGVVVSLFTQNGSYDIASTYTDDAGRYALALPSGQDASKPYRLRTGNHSYGFVDHVYEAWNDRQCSDGVYWRIDSCEGAGLISLPASGDLEQIDFALGSGQTVSGRVLDAMTGLPVAGAEVELHRSNAGTRDAYTDSAGRYRLEGVVAGTYRVTAAHTTHGGQVYAGVDCDTSCYNVSGTPVTVTRSAGAKDVDFTLKPWSYIDAELSVAGEPFNGSLFFGPSFGLYLANGASVNANWSLDTSTRRYRIGPLAIGSYLLKGRTSGTYWRLYNGVDCSGDCNDQLGQATTIAITQSGDRPQVSLNLTPYPRLSGVVRNRATGEPISGAYVRLYRSTSPNSYSYSVQTDAAGAYRFAVSPGNYFIHVDAVGYTDQISPGLDCEAAAPVTACPAAQTVNFALGTADQARDFDLSPSAAIRIRVTAQGRTLSTSSYLDQPSLFAASGARVSQYSHNTVIESGGAITLYDVAPGQYYLGISGDGYYPQLVGGTACVSSSYYAYSFEHCSFAEAELLTLASADLQVAVDLRRWGSRRVRVLRASTEQPIAGVALDLWNAEGRSLGNASTDAEGRAELVLSGVRYADEALPVRLSTDNYLGLLDQVYQNIECAVGTSVFRGGCSLSGATSITLPETNPSASEIIIRLSSPAPSGALIFRADFE